MNKKGVVYAFFANLLKEYEEKSSFEDAVVNAVQVANAEINLKSSENTIDIELDAVGQFWQNVEEKVKKICEANNGICKLRINVKNVRI